MKLLKNAILDDVLVEKLLFSGMGLGTLPDGKKILISGGAIPESRVRLRVLREKKGYIETQILATVQRSPLEATLPAHFRVYGGCRWLPIRYDDQLRIKSEQVREAFHHLGEETHDTVFHPIIPSPEIYGYRNKLEFSFGTYISEREGIHDTFRFGFHQPAVFDRIIDCTYCVLADESINAIFREVDAYTRASGLPTYDPNPNQRKGFYRHFVVRKAKATLETMLILSVHPDYPGYTADTDIHLQTFFEGLRVRHPEIASVYLLRNDGKADIVQGEYVLLSGAPYITERLLGRTFRIHPRSFFQTNSLGAEALYSRVRDLAGTGEYLLDLYGGTGTIGLLLADHYEHIVSVECITEASCDGQANAERNDIENIEFVCAKTEDFLRDFAVPTDQKTPQKRRDSTVVIDPPRDGMHPDALTHIRAFGPERIIYVSCNPATLARDLAILIAEGAYRITDVVPVDMFPHTHHIETVVRLERIE